LEEEAASSILPYITSFVELHVLAVELILSPLPSPSLLRSSGSSARRSSVLASQGSGGVGDLKEEEGGKDAGRAPPTSGGVSGRRRGER
jgi:hypothetical protein